MNLGTGILCEADSEDAGVCPYFASKTIVIGQTFTSYSNHSGALGYAH